jgi:hypothetical protein
MGTTHFDRVSGVNGLYVGAKGAEKVIADSLGRMYLNFEPGAQFYVDSVHGSTSGDGLTWATALAGIDAAVGKCTANHGDVIWVAPGHNEGITAASAIDLDVAGITVIGLGTGSLKPTIDFDHADAGFVIGADNVTVKNIRFRCSVTGVKIGVAVEAGVDSYQILGCDFGWAEAAGTDEFLIAVNLLAGCNDGLIEGNTFAAGAAGATVAIKLVGASDNIIIRNNRFTGACSTAFINGITTPSTNLLIQGNIMQQGATEPGIELLTGTTGIIADNYIATDLATIAASIVADACWLFNNYYCEVAPETGVLVGTPSANDG